MQYQLVYAIRTKPVPPSANLYDLNFAYSILDIWERRYKKRQMQIAYSDGGLTLTASDPIDGKEVFKASLVEAKPLDLTLPCVEESEMMLN